MKILFVTFNGINDSSFGGGKCSQRNYNLLNNYGEVTLFHIVKRSNFYSLMSILEGFFPPSSIKDYYKIKQMINSNEYDLVFFDGSNFGKFSLLCKKTNVKTIVFYHNCEYDYINVRFDHFSLKKLAYKFLSYFNEKRTTKLCDIRVALSERDRKRILDIYGILPEYILPLSLMDTYKFRQKNTNESFCLLFGASNTANNNGYKWFIENVSPYINCKTVIAGKGYDQFVNWSNEKVQVIGFVEDIAQLYANAECVAIPLFSGGGMKIKTLEGLMYGKTIFGTDEAFEGFDIKINTISVRCNNKNDFISNINNFLIHPEPFNNNARKLYLEKYNYCTSENVFSKIIEEFKFSE